MTTLSNAAWRFAPTGDGVLYGYNNAGTEHFKQDTIGKLVRETIQNSLDAHQDGLPPVIVDIYECDIAAEHIGATSLKPHLERALARTITTGQVDGQKDYRKALGLVGKATIPCLAIVDRNTTGLHGRKWDSLIYEEGTPEKDGPGSPGGSFGIGKNAPYNVAALHTVIYCTRYTNGRQGRVEKMTGRAQLVSHASPHNGVMLQNIGFYAAEGNQPIVGPDIPVPFRLDEAGTGLWISGFKPERVQWRGAAVRATIDSFFYAIHNRHLIVNISPRRDGSDSYYLPRHHRHPLGTAQRKPSDCTLLPRHTQRAQRKHGTGRFHWIVGRAYQQRKGCATPRCLCQSQGYADYRHPRAATQQSLLPRQRARRLARLRRRSYRHRGRYRPADAPDGKPGP